MQKCTQLMFLIPISYNLPSNMNSLCYNLEYLKCKSYLWVLGIITTTNHGFDPSGNHFNAVISWP